MAEFRVVLDGLELDDHEHAAVAQAVLEAGLKAVGNLDRFSGSESASSFATISAGKLDFDDGPIRGGWVLQDSLATRAREVLQDQGLIARELGPMGRG